MFGAGVMSSNDLPAVEAPKIMTPSTPMVSTTVVMVNTPPKPREAAKMPMMDGARMLPIRPTALARPTPVARIQVGKSSGV